MELGYRFVDLNGSLVKTRQRTGATKPSGAPDSQEAMSSNLKKVMDRMALLEAGLPLPWTEFEMSCPGTGSIYMEHGYGCPVRWWVTGWREATNTPYRLSEDTASSTTNTLYLFSDQAGRAVIRVEASQYGLLRGNT